MIRPERHSTRGTITLLVNSTAEYCCHHSLRMSFHVQKCSSNLHQWSHGMQIEIQLLNEKFKSSSLFGYHMLVKPLATQPNCSLSLSLSLCRKQHHHFSVSFTHKFEYAPIHPDFLILIKSRTRIGSFILNFIQCFKFFGFSFFLIRSNWLENRAVRAATSLPASITNQWYSLISLRLISSLWSDKK